MINNDSHWNSFTWFIMIWYHDGEFHTGSARGSAQIPSRAEPLVWTSPPHRSGVRVQCSFRVLAVQHWTWTAWNLQCSALQLPWFGCSVDSGGPAMPEICTPLRSGSCSSDQRSQAYKIKAEPWAEPVKNSPIVHDVVFQGAISSIPIYLLSHSFWPLSLLQIIWCENIECCQI